MTAAILALVSTFASLPSLSNQLPGVIRIGAILTGWWYLRNVGQTFRVGMELNEQCTTPRYGEEHLSKEVCQRTKPSNNHRGQYRYTLPHYVNGPTILALSGLFWRQSLCALQMGLARVEITMEIWVTFLHGVSLGYKSPSYSAV